MLLACAADPEGNDASDAQLLDMIQASVGCKIDPLTIEPLNFPDEARREVINRGHARIRALHKGMGQ